jgi:hypothetical protein
VDFVFALYSTTDPIDVTEICLPAKSRMKKSKYYFRTHRSCPLIFGLDLPVPSVSIYEARPDTKPVVLYRWRVFVSKAFDAMFETDTLQAFQLRDLHFTTVKTATHPKLQGVSR